MVATAATPNTRPTRAGPTPRRVARCSASTGSSIDSVAATTITAIAHEAMAGVPRTTRIGTMLRVACIAGMRSHRKPAAAAADSAVTNRNGSRMPPSSYSQPPSDGPIMIATLVPDMTIPAMRPRSSSP